MRFFAAAACALTFFAAAGPAAAFCRQTTSPSFTPTAAKPCDDVGKPLFWPSKCVGFSVQKDGSARVPLTDAERFAAAAYGAWTSVDCPTNLTACTGSGGGAPSIAVRDLGEVACDKVEFNPKQGNANVLVFRDAAWPHGANELALTTLVFNTETGEILDGDMEVNGAHLSTSDPPAKDGYDLASILTHEAGHFYGLGHTQPSNTTSTMFSKYQAGQSFMRDLAPDDVCGICNAYPPQRAATCSDTPRGGLVSACGSEQPAPSSNGCSCDAPGSTATGTAGAAGALGIALALGAFARRRRGAARR